MRLCVVVLQNTIKLKWKQQAKPVQTLSAVANLRLQ